MENTKAHLTAITRNKLSVPMRLLNKNNLLVGDMLDFGCGKGFDADQLGMDKYDPHYSPEYPTKKYDTITCNYVLNVVKEDMEETIINEIKNLLKENGTAYITVRRDVKENGFTKKGTYQRNVILNLPILKETSTYCIYKL